MWAICSCNSSAPNYVWTTFAETSYIRLLVYRLLEKKLGEEFACSEILKTLRDMNMILLSKDSGCIPSYKRTKLTDALHSAFGFRTDYEFISRQIYGHLSKKQCRKNNTISKIVKYRCEKGNSHTPDKYWGYGCFLLYKVSKMGF